MTRRAKIHLIGLPLMPILILASTGSKCANAQAKLDAYYTATLLGVPIGHISWVVDLKENHFTSVATGSIAGLLRLFLDLRKDRSRRRVAYLAVSRSRPNSN